MAKRSPHHQTHYTRAAATLLGQLIRRRRIEGNMTVEELADRAGLSRPLVHRIERGDLGCSIGNVFEAATIVGLKLFDADGERLDREISTNTSLMTLLPRSVRASTKVKDDF